MLSDLPSTIRHPKPVWHIVGVCVLSIVCHTMDAAGAVSYGRQVLLNRGLQIQTWVMNPLANADVSLWHASNFTAPNLIWSSREQKLASPGWDAQPWSREYGPDYPNSKYLSSAELPYLSTFVSMGYGDELDITDPALLSDMQTTYSDWHQRYPNALVYTNNTCLQTAAQLTTYMQSTRPDMLMFDDYPGYNFPETGSQSRNEWYSTMQTYRTVALKGYDGTSASPIAYAQHLNLFRPSYNASLPSESYVRLQQNASWAFGYTFVNGFVYNEPAPAGTSGVCPVIFDSFGATAPNVVFNYVAEANRESRNLGPALIRLVSTDVRMIPGKVNGSTLSRPSGMATWASGNRKTGGYTDYITSITQRGKSNTSSPSNCSDLLVGYFKPLLSDNTGCTFADGLHFMLVNGAAGTPFLPGAAGDPASNSAEWFRINFNFGTSAFDSLVRLSRDTGRAELVPLTSTGGSNYYLDLNLPGGTGNLFAFWDASNPLPTVPEPGTFVMLTVALIGALAYTWRRRK